MTITLPHDWEQFVAAKVGSSRYSSAADVVADGLRLLREQEEREQELQDLRREIAVGLADVDAGRVAPFDPVAALEQIRARKGQAG